MSREYLRRHFYRTLPVARFKRLALPERDRRRNSDQINFLANVSAALRRRSDVLARGDWLDRQLGVL